MNPANSTPVPVCVAVVVSVLHVAPPPYSQPKSTVSVVAMRVRNACLFSYHFTCQHGVVGVEAMAIGRAEDMAAPRKY